MKKILVIEDEITIRNNLLELLDAEHYWVLGAENGQQGLDLAREYLPDLVVCDVMMPELDGYQVLETLRQEATTAAIPFIFLTAKAEKSDLRQGMEWGADDYLTKPFTREELLKAIASRLSKQDVVVHQTEKKLNELRSNISQALPHEFMTPLSVILMSSDVLLKHYASLEAERIEEMLGGINRMANRLQRLIQNILLYAELEVTASDPARISKLRTCRTSATRTILSGIAQNKAYNCGREADLKLELEEGSAAIAQIKLEKLVGELIENALSYSLPGTPVHLTTTRDQNYLYIYVLDRGRGMTSEQICRIGAYVQFERNQYEQQGSGLGLTIAKRLAELHGGRLHVESIAGKQTLVSVSLPL